MRETASLSGVILKLSTTVRMIWGKGMMVRLGSGGMDGFEFTPPISSSRIILYGWMCGACY